MKLLDLTNNKFGRLLVISREGVNSAKEPLWKCICDCGNEKIIRGVSLRTGATKSCGCLSIELAVERGKVQLTKHGQYHHPLYHTWVQMISRCHNEKDDAYKYYGGRGIKVCERWRESLNHFSDDMGEKLVGKYSIERIDNNDHYCRDNCKWGTDMEQGNNKRNTIFITYNDVCLSIARWADKLKVSPSTLYARYHKGWNKRHLKGDMMVMLLTCADLHITNKRPQNRKDDYFETCMNKFEQILDIARREEVEGILVAGDFFDSPTVPYFVTKRVIELINDYSIPLYVIPGQHDLRYHTSGLDNTPMGMLLTCGRVYLLHPDTKHNIRNITVVGAGWNEEPSVEGDILVMHRMVTMDGALFAGQDESEYITGHQLIHKYPWAKCIITGDNHQRFRVITDDGRVLVNCGSMMRSSKAQIDYEPAVRIIDTDDWQKDRLIELEIKPSEYAFDFQKMDREEVFQEEKKRASEEIAHFVKSLETTEENKPDFKSVLQQVVLQVNPGEKVESIIQKVMEEVE